MSTQEKEGPFADRLTAHNYPELYAELQPILERIREDYPNDSIAPIFILPQEEEYKLGPDEGNIIAIYKMGDNALSENLEHDEQIIVSETMLLVYGPKQVAAAIAHEIGHDMHDHQFVKDKSQGATTNEAQRVAECEADHFAGHYASGRDLALFHLANPTKNYPPDSTHPHSSDRIKALMDKEALDISPGLIEFNEDCTINDVAVPPNNSPSVSTSIGRDR